MSWDDLKAAFYVFRLPSQWKRLFTFAAEFSSSDFGLDGPVRPVWLGAVAIPMGWRNAVGVVQYLHRRLLLGWCSPSRSVETSVGLPLAREARRDRPFPLVSSTSVAQSTAWQVYIDDLDILCVYSVGSEPADAQLQAVARERYEAWGAPLSLPKFGTHASDCTRLGAAVAGVSGTLGLPACKAVKLIGLTLYCISQPVSKFSLQVLGGNWSSALLYRREVSTCLQSVWQTIRAWPSWGKRFLPVPVVREFLLCICHLPLLSYNLRSSLSTVVTASDASEYAGGICSAMQLSQHGKDLLLRDAQLIAGGAVQLLRL
eukprot:6488142-Amphidinium_carterae.1